jgi:hypothetical protein
MTSRIDSCTHSSPALHDPAPGHVVNSRLEISHPVPSDTLRTKGAAVGKKKLAPFLFWKALAGLLAFDVLGFGGNFVRMHRFVSNWRVCAEELGGDPVDKICTAVNDACIWYPMPTALCNNHLLNAPLWSTGRDGAGHTTYTLQGACLD